MPNRQAVLVCSGCGDRFTETHAVEFEFFIANGLCYTCCKRMFRKPADDACFGKLYNATAIECKQLCPDRKVCPLFQTGKIMKYRELTKEAREQALKFLLSKDKKKRKYRRNRTHPFRQGCGTYDAFQLCREGATRTELQELCSAANLDIRRILRLFRRGESNGHSWKWSEDNGEFKISY